MKGMITGNAASNPWYLQSPESVVANITHDILVTCNYIYSYIRVGTQ